MTSGTTLVTGGAGFVGSHLCESLLEDNKRVICFDNFSSGSEKNIRAFRDNPDFSLINADVRNEVISTLLKNDIEMPLIDEIYHLASRASPDDFEEYPLDVALTNTIGMRHVLELAREVDARVIHASTSEIYGNPKEHPQTEAYNGNVNPRGPRACYDEGKRFAETLAVNYNEVYGVDARTVRLFNTYGPRMRQDDGRVIPTFLTQALTGQDLSVYGDGTQTRSFLYVSDQVRGMRSFMSQPNLGGEVINIGSTDEITINKLAETMLSIVDTDSDIVYEPLPEGDPERRQPDISRAERLLDWGPSIDLETGIKKTLRDFESKLEV